MQKPDETQPKRLSLTFDNGPTPGITDHVLDCLDEFGIKATFFLVGQQLETTEGRALLERTFAAGHQIGNHSFSHGEPLGSSVVPGNAAREILRTYELLGEFAGPSPLYRPNGRGKVGPHLLNREAIDTLTAVNGTIVLWNSVPKDRAVVVESPEFWVSDAKSHVEANDWTLMVLHDRPSGFPAPGPMAFLPDFLRWAIERVEFRLDFPAEYTPLLRGRADAGLARYVSDLAA